MITGVDVWIVDDDEAIRLVRQSPATHRPFSRIFASRMLTGSAWWTCSCSGPSTSRSSP